MVVYMDPLGNTQNYHTVGNLNATKRKKFGTLDEARCRV